MLKINFRPAIFFKEADLSHSCQLNVRNLYGHYVESLFPITIEWYLALSTSEEIRKGRGRELSSKAIVGNN